MGRTGKESIPYKTMEAVFSLKEDPGFNSRFTVNDLDLDFSPRTTALRVFRLMSCVECIGKRDVLENGRLSTNVWELGECDSKKCHFANNGKRNQPRASCPEIEETEKVKV